MKTFLYQAVILFVSLSKCIPLLAQTGPAGVGNSTSNILWLKTDSIVGLSNGDRMSTWEDASGNGNDLSQTNTALRPEYITNSVNGFPVVSFNTANDRLIRNPFTGFATTNITGIYVNKNTESNDGILSYAAPGSNNEFLFYASQNIGFYRGPNVNTGISTNDNNWHIIQGSWGSVGGSVEMWKDGRKDYIGTNFRAGTSIIQGGSLCLAHEQDAPDGGYAANQDHIGEFTEVIIYNTFLDRSDHIIVANYLSAKYDIPLADADIYVQDDPANGDFDFEVAGIGRFSINEFNDDAQGSANVRINNPSNLTNGKYMIWGHNGLLPFANNITDIPASVQARYDRVWRVSETNIFGVAQDVGSVDLTWDLNNTGPVTVSDLRLLVDTDNDGVFNDETPIAGATDLGGGFYRFNAVTALANNLRFTLATINTAITPLPITLTNFTGKHIGENRNQLAWTTSSESNNDYFTIEKSTDAQNWTHFEDFKGAGNSSATINYTAVDDRVSARVTYYRLSQTDFDGTRTIKKIIAVKQLSSYPNHEITVFPNPTTGLLYVTGVNSINDIKVYNSFGQLVGISIDSNAELGAFTIDLGDQSSGLYLLRVGQETIKIIVNQ